MNLPAYIDFGARETAPAPFLCEGGHFLGIVLKGDIHKIGHLCDRMLNVPAAGKVVYKPIGRSVVLVTGSFAQLRSEAPGFPSKGFVKETQLCLLVPLAAGHRVGSLFVCDRLVMAAPYVFVNNPMSLVNGREEFGYAKALAQFKPPSGRGEQVQVKTFGGNFGIDDEAGWCEVLQIEQLGIFAEPVAPTVTVPEAITAALLIDSEQDAEPTPGADIVGDFVETFFGDDGTQVMLKQSRDAAESERACYQEVVEVASVMENVSLRFAAPPWQVTVTQLDSHPIGIDLGIQTQTSWEAFEFDADMILGPGTVVGP